MGCHLCGASSFKRSVLYVTVQIQYKVLIIDANRILFFRKSATMQDPLQKDPAPEPLRTILLDNGARLDILDESCPLVGDRWQVTAVFRLTIPVSEAVLAGGSAHLNLAEVRRRIGDAVTFEKRLERNFIGDDEKDALLAEMIRRYLDGVLGYIANPAFARNYLLKRYAEALNKAQLRP